MGESSYNTNFSYNRIMRKPVWLRKYEREDATKIVTTINANQMRSKIYRLAILSFWTGDKIFESIIIIV